MIEICVKYIGYPGDRYYNGHEGQEALDALIPGSKHVGVQRFYWLNQKGFGHGYFNNSGAYAHFQRFKVKEMPSEEVMKELKKRLGTLSKVYDTKEEYEEDMKKVWKFAKEKNKQNPY